MSSPLRLVLWLTLMGMAVGLAHGHGNAVAAGSPVLGFDGMARGAATGAIITVILASFEVLMEQRPELIPLARASFLVHLVGKSLVYIAAILFGLWLGARLFPSRADFDIERGDIVFSIIVAFAFNFVFSINRLLGQHVLLNFITGRYHRPRLEERIFLFIDMQGSTALAERLGELAFHRLVNRFVVDLTGPIVAAGGEIHRYVGDELIATWKLAPGVRGARCLRGCFAALDRLEELAPAYVEAFGTAVSCRAGLHCGPVVTGEMGSLKKEIVFLGDTVNTTARIQEMCRATGHQVLASATLIDRLALPRDILARPLGDLRLRGKARDVALYALEKAPAAAAVAA